MPLEEVVFSSEEGVAPTWRLTPEVSEERAKKYDLAAHPGESYRLILPEGTTCSRLH